MNKPKATTVILSIGLAASLALSGTLLGVTVYQNKEVSSFIAHEKKLEAEAEEKSNEYQEDGFVVADSYEIKSTKQISDAYISGDDSKLSDEDKETLKLAEDVISECGITDDMSDFEKEEKIYDWMYNNIGQGQSTTVLLPNATNDQYTPHGVLTGHNAVCVGYATTFRMFMQMFGMDVHIVHNDYHSWDLIKLDDDNWYHTDIYSDVSAKTEYQNFNMTDNLCANGHEWDESALPAANGVKYSYANQHNKELDDIYSLPEAIKKSLQKNKDSMYFSFKSNPSEDELKLADTVVNCLNQAISYGSVSIAGVDDPTMVSATGSWYVGEDDKYILGIFVSDYTDSGSSSGADQELVDKMTEAFNKAFNTSVGTDNTDIADGSDDTYFADGTDPDYKNYLTDSTTEAVQ